jgi:hypothetical protein
VTAVLEEIDDVEARFEDMFPEVTDDLETTLSKLRFETSRLVTVVLLLGLFVRSDVFVALVVLLRCKLVLL